VAFNKKNPKGMTLAKQFQQGLAKLIASGKYAEIIKNHIGDATVEQYFVLPRR
jgi:ABC-type amino acid transport substrate-binding protein